jgi:hypothetical protein
MTNADTVLALKVKVKKEKKVENRKQLRTLFSVS